MTIENKKMQRIALRLYKKKVIKNTILRLSRVPKGKVWIFILGCYNSGTTLLNFLLGLHPEISILPTEGVALSDLLLKPEDFGWPRMIHKCSVQVGLDELDNQIDCDRIKKEWAFWYDSRKTFYAEKSVSNISRIKWINRNFDNPYFLWIIRNGYCVAEGIRRRVNENRKYSSPYYPEGYPIELCAEQWMEANGLIENDTRSIKKIMRISYEDLTSDLEKTMSKVIQWLPVYNKTVPKFGEFAFHETKQPVINMNDRSIAKLSKDEIRKITEKAERSLKNWGYELL